MAMAPTMSQSIDNVNSIDNGKNNDKTIKINELNNNDSIVVVKASTIPENTNTSTKNTTVNNNSSNNDSKNKKAVKPSKLSQAKIISASSNVSKFVNKNKKLPNFVTIDGYKFSIPEYMYLVSKTISLRNNKDNSKVIVKYDIKNPTNLKRDNIKGIFTKKQYSTYSKNIVNFIMRNGFVPSFVDTKLGKMQYQTTVFALNSVLVSMEKNKKLPKNLRLNIKKNHRMNKIMPRYVNPASLVGNNYKIIAFPKGEDFFTVKAKTLYGPIDVKFNSKYLISTARCSCGVKGNYFYHSAAFINYCPYCKVNGTMHFYDHPRISPEGMWYCLRCDSDYCLVTGKEHVISRPMQLKIATF